MRISDWSSDVCSSDLICVHRASSHALQIFEGQRVLIATGQDLGRTLPGELSGVQHTKEAAVLGFTVDRTRTAGLQESDRRLDRGVVQARSEEHTSELQSLMRISYAVFCLKKKKQSN